MGALTLADLTPMAGEPTVRDVRLGEVLGFTRARDLRQLIKANLDELMMHGLARRVAAPIQSGRGRVQIVDEFWLNEAQALLVCMFARTEKAAAVRKQVIDVFLAWRRGELTESPAPDRTIEALNRLEARLSALEGAGVQLAQLQKAPELVAMALTHAEAVYPHGPRRRRPKWWSNQGIRALLVVTHRQMSLDEAMAIVREKFGQSPSRSSIHRFWCRLDELLAAHPSMRVH